MRKLLFLDGNILRLVIAAAIIIFSIVMAMGEQGF